MDTDPVDKTSFNAMQVSVFKVNHDLRVEGFNVTISHPFAPYSCRALNERVGDALRCINSFEHEKGCGFATACSDCVVRKAISACFHSGMVIRKRVEMKLRHENTSSWHKFIITATPLQDSGVNFVALIVEDLQATLSNEKLALQIDGIHSCATGQYHDIIEDHLIKYRAVTFQPATQG